MQSSFAKSSARLFNEAFLKSSDWICWQQKQHKTIWPFFFKMCKWSRSSKAIKPLCILLCSFELQLCAGTLLQVFLKVAPDYHKWKSQLLSLKGVSNLITKRNQRRRQIALRQQCKHTVKNILWKTFYLIISHKSCYYKRSWMWVKGAGWQVRRESEG